MKKLIQRFDLQVKVQKLSNTDQVRFTHRLARILTAIQQHKEPPQTWYDKRGRRWEIWDLETAVDWR